MPSQVTTTESSARGATKRGTRSGEASVPTLLKGQVSQEAALTTDEREAAERTFDPLWTNARRLLDLLAEHELIQRDLWTARLGQFVLVTGRLVMLDVATFKDAWQKPAVKQMLIADAQAKVVATPGQSKVAHTAAKDKARSDTGVLVELLAVMPHVIQVKLFGPRFNAWCTLAESSLVGPASDIVLKHGAYVQGTWNLLGILDADPDLAPEPAPGEEPGESLDDVIADMFPSGIAKMTAQMAPMTRNLMGRPRTAFGVTPLLIFREVTG